MSGRLLSEFLGGACPVTRGRLKISCSEAGSDSVNPQQRHTPRERQQRKSRMPKEEDANFPGINQAVKRDGKARLCVHNGKGFRQVFSIHFYINAQGKYRENSF